MQSLQILRRGNNTIPFIEDEVKKILGDISESIRKADASNISNIQYVLPTKISIPNMNNSNAQRIVYFKIIKSIEETKDYNIKITSKADKGINYTILNLSWQSITANDAEIKAMDEYLSKFSN